MSDEPSLYDLWSTYSLEAIQARITALEASLRELIEVTHQMREACRQVAERYQDVLEADEDWQHPFRWGTYDAVLARARALVGEKT